MTRINLIHETQLSPDHLGGEYHEITRVFTLVRARVLKGHSTRDVKIPPEFKLNRGHVTFFYDKLSWVSRRYVKLGLELKYRNPESKTDLSLMLKVISDARRDIPEQWWNDWEPTPMDVEISLARILERL